MKVIAARFLGAAATPGGGPPPGPPEVAIAGRSNVGKSALINVLVGRRGLARASRTPGRTRQLNFFALDERLVLVDLPGYGFAVGPEAERRAWKPLVETYLGERPTLRGVLLVVDARRGLEAEEEELLAYLAALGRPAAVAATKLDKLGRAEARRALAAAAARLGGAVPLIGFSARTGEGRIALWPVVDVIEPGARAAATRTRNGRVGVIGTEATIASGAYTMALRALKPGLEIYTRPCPLLVALAEEGWVEGPIPQSVVETYLGTLQKSGIDTLVLGCTHYPLLKAVIAEVMGERVALVDSAEETARAVADLLEARDLARRRGTGSTSFFVTDVPDRFIRIGQRFLGARLESAVRIER